MSPDSTISVQSSHCTAQTVESIESMQSILSTVSDWLNIITATKPPHPSDAINPELVASQARKVSIIYNKSCYPSHPRVSIAMR